jgi:hypothetical protein
MRFLSLVITAAFAADPSPIDEPFGIRIKGGSAQPIVPGVIRGDTEFKGLIYGNGYGSPLKDDCRTYLRTDDDKTLNADSVPSAVNAVLERGRVDPASSGKLSKDLLSQWTAELKEIHGIYSFSELHCTGTIGKDEKKFAIYQFKNTLIPAYNPFTYTPTFLTRATTFKYTHGGFELTVTSGEDASSETSPAWFTGELKERITENAAKFCEALYQRYKDINQALTSADKPGLWAKISGRGLKADH